jgi:transposase
LFTNVLVPPTLVEHHRSALDTATLQVREALQTHALHDLLVAIERTGRSPRPVQRAFASAGFEVRIVHPFATKQFRQPRDPGYKTDDTDRAAIPRAAVNGFALLEAERDEFGKTFQLLIGHRRDLVGKSAALCCQIREHLDAALPGFACCFDKLWASAVAWHLAHPFAAPVDLVGAGLAGLCQSLDEAGVR